jgi:hypothetical protein
MELDPKPTDPAKPEAARPQPTLRSQEIRIPSAEAPAERIGRLLDAPLAPPVTGRIDGVAAGRRLDPEVTLRLLRGREEGARRGKHQSGTAPYGYVRDYSKRAKAKADPTAKGVPLVIHAEEAEVVRLIYRLYLRHRSMKKVIEVLHARGLRTRRGKEWSRAGISWILKNDTYLGRVHFGAIRTRGEHEAIIAPIVYYKAQKLIRKNDKRGRRGRGSVVVSARGSTVE